MRKAVSLHVTGIVQGVGFRPFVYNLAVRLGLTGWVKNTSEGVFVLAEGVPETLRAFEIALRDDAPPMAVVESVTAEEVDDEGHTSFEIIESESREGAMTLVSPDIATCEACTLELFDPDDRRYRYPFINCTNCGPRFTIIDDVPYDRPMTTMRDFPMCEACATEYAEPSDRRFHAQPDACPACGPRLYLNEPDSPHDWAWTPDHETVPRPHRDPVAEGERSDALLRRAADLILAGRILAIKGLGGFHLACDATNEEAVSLLRSRKHRWGKPLAIMLPDLQTARALCEVDDQEADLLAGTTRPIVLLRLRDEVIAEAGGEVAPPAIAHEGASADGSDQNVGSSDAPPSVGGGEGGGPERVLQAGKAPQDVRWTSEDAAGPRRSLPEHGASPLPSAPRLAPSLAPGLRELGVMLPYTPLHHLLLRDVGRPLVMTSGNLSDEPIAMDNAEALSRLSAIADAFLLHDRPIHARYDDSVARVVESRPEMVRRARGYAPFPLTLPFASDVDILATGPEQKNTFTLVRGAHAFVSQHIGDLENAETMQHFEESLDLYRRLFRVEPRIVAYDLHPEYLSSKFALSLGLPTVGVQHHHAHIVSVTAEHGVSQPVVGIAFDGTGYGTDGHIWGGEVLTADWSDFQRFAHLAEVPLVGGAAAVRRPARMAVATLATFGLLDHPGAEPLRSRLAQGEEATLLRMMERGLNSPLTSSMGRLFDAVAAVAGVRDDAGYEGQAAIELEAIADAAEERSYSFGLIGDTPVLIDPRPVLEALLGDLASGVQAHTVSARFHAAVVDVIVRIGIRASASAGTRFVALAGGVFMNRLILGGAFRRLEASGLTPLTHMRLPINDGAVSYGQAIVAWARRHAL